MDCYRDLTVAVNAIRGASLPELKDAAYLERTLLPGLGLNDEVLREFPEHLYPWCGFGLRSWQYPCQFAQYLTFISDKNIRTYAEIGVRHGGTFIITLEYLRRFNAIQLAYAVDIEPSPLLSVYASMNPDVTYQIGSSRSQPVTTFLHGRPWDLVLIDGDHSSEGCRLDFECVRHGAGLVALHDICSDSCPGVVEVWQLIRQTTPASRLTEFVTQYDDVFRRTGGSFLGIGIVSAE
jgi:cephalosporin hydroxylase